MKLRWIRPALAIIFGAVCAASHCSPANAAQETYAGPRQEIMTGIGLSRIHNKGTYNFVPVFYDINFDLRPYFERKGLHPWGILDAVWELGGAYVYTPDPNAEIATNFLIKVGLCPSTWRVQPYFKGGVGFLYETAHIPFQETQFNFNEYGGLGAHYFMKPDMALSLEYRFRHFSNADIKKPNWGVNSNLILLGISTRF